MIKKSGKVGVCWHKGNGCWQSRFSVNGKPVHLGNFVNLEDAIEARVEAELKYNWCPSPHLDTHDSLTQAQLKKELAYCPASGVFVRLRTRGGCPVGAVVGGDDGDGYLKAGIGGIQFRLHRLAYLYMEGWMPVEVDHIDHVRNNNRWENLRPATRRANCRNTSLLPTNTSGVCGVHWAKAQGKWLASTHINRKSVHLGYFDKFEDAVAARAAADIKYGFHPNHGKKL